MLEQATYTFLNIPSFLPTSHDTQTQHTGKEDRLSGHRQPPTCLMCRDGYHYEAPVNDCQCVRYKEQRSEGYKHAGVAVIPVFRYSTLHSLSLSCSLPFVCLSVCLSFLSILSPFPSLSLPPYLYVCLCLLVFVSLPLPEKVA